MPEDTPRYKKANIATMIFFIYTAKVICFLKPGSMNMCLIKFNKSCLRIHKGMKESLIHKIPLNPKPDH